MKLSPYIQYKPSGVEWLGDVPGHWEVRRIRTLSMMRVSNVDKHSKENEKSIRLCNYVDVYKNDHISKDMEFMHATATPDEIDRFQLKIDDVLITKDSETPYDIGVPALVVQTSDDLISGYHLALLRPLKNLLRGSYLFYTLNNQLIAYQLHVEAKGVTRYGLSYNAIKSVWIPLPPLPEQTAIARFLDYKTQRIQQYIDVKQKLVALLKEQKQAIIQRAVTRGLNPDVRLKPSGAEWLGDVPEHWYVSRFRNEVANITEQTKSIENNEVYIALENIESWTGKIINIKPKSRFDSQVKKFKSDDLLFGKLRPYLAKVTRPDRNGVCVSEFLVLRPRNGIFLVTYLEQLLRSKLFIDTISSSAFGAKMPRAEWQFISNLKIPLPPLPEQTAIVDYLDKKTADIDTFINRTNRQIELMQEYRTRLISDVVTGKVDVRAINVPEISGDDANNPADSNNVMNGG